MHQEAPARAAAPAVLACDAQKSPLACGRLCKAKSSEGVQHQRHSARKQNTTTITMKSSGLQRTSSMTAMIDRKKRPIEPASQQARARMREYVEVAYPCTKQCARRSGWRSRSALPRHHTNTSRAGARRQFADPHDPNSEQRHGRNKSDALAARVRF